MNYEHEWPKAARQAVCSEPLLDCDEFGLFAWHVGETQTLIDRMAEDEREATTMALEAEDDCAGSGWIAVD